MDFVTKRKKFHKTLFQDSQNVKIVKTVRGSITLNPAALDWLVNGLLEACMQGEDCSFWSKLREPNRLLLFEIRKNGQGSFIALRCLQGNSNGVRICIPCGKKGSGWRDFASFLRARQEGRFIPRFVLQKNPLSFTLE